MTPPLNPRVIQERLQHLEENIRTLRGLQSRTREELHRDRALQWAVEHGLQTSIETVIDIGTHLIGALGLPAPRDYTSVIDIMGEHGIIPPEFAAQLRSMPGFRNILVHQYLAVDLDRVFEALQKAPGEFAEFIRHITEFMRRNGFDIFAS